MPGILFDARCLLPDMTGVGYYMLRLLESLPGPKEGMGIILPAGSPYLGRFPGFRIFEAGIGITSHPLTDLYEQAVIPFLCYRHGYGAFVSFEARVPLFHPGIRTCCFVYDLAFLKVKGSHSFRYSAYLYLALKLFSRSASRILTISDTVRAQICASLGLPESRITVIHPADSGLASKPAEPVAVARRPFFLAVGATNPRKNLIMLLRAFELIRRDHPDSSLAITGNKAWVAACIAETGTTGALNLGFIREGELRYLYEHAVALVFPSLDEGFGIPLVDAAMLDCPLLCSDIPVFREVAGDCARYFDPLDPISIARAMAEALENREHGKGDAMRERFTWGKSGARFLEEMGFKGL